MKEDSLSRKVYDEIRRKILSNQLLPGTRLKEDAWAKKMGVSRVSVREALNRLLGESAVVVGEKGGYYVKTMTVDDVKEIRELRQVVELGAIKLLIEKLTDDDVAELEQICDDFTRMVNSGYLSGACEADIKFHESIIRMARNEKLFQVYQLSNIPLFHLKLGQALSHMDDYELTDREHRALVEALKSRDLAVAELALSKHLQRGEQESVDLAVG